MGAGSVVHTRPVGNRPRSDQHGNNHVYWGTLAVAAPVLIAGVIVSVWVEPGGWWLLYDAFALIYGFVALGAFLYWLFVRYDPAKKRKSTPRR
jgi:hypothetical protein